MKPLQQAMMGENIVGNLSAGAKEHLWKPWQIKSASDLQISDGARSSTQVFVNTHKKHKAELNALRRGQPVRFWTTHTKTKGEVGDSSSCEVRRDLGLNQNQAPGWTLDC